MALVHCWYVEKWRTFEYWPCILKLCYNHILVPRVLVKSRRCFTYMIDPQVILCILSLRSSAITHSLNLPPRTHTHTNCGCLLRKFLVSSTWREFYFSFDWNDFAWVCIGGFLHVIKPYHSSSVLWPLISISRLSTRLSKTSCLWNKNNPDV